MSVRYGETSGGYRGDMSPKRIPIDTRVAGHDAVRAARAERRRRALSAFVLAPDPVDLEGYLRGLSALDREADAHTIPQQIA